MNPLGRGFGGVPPQFQSSINQVKNMMRLAQGNPSAIINSNPALSQIMQANKGMSPEQIFRNMAQQRGIDADAFLRELRG